jgi:CubicO group peptidase (beta-lactamase class C family)
MHREKSLVAGAVLLVTALSSIRAQQAGVTNLPDAVVARIDSAFSGISGVGTPGCAIGLSQNGKTVLTRAYGMANLEYAVPNSSETIFESGSVAKQFTAAAVELLVQDGKLSLDDDIRKYVPEVPNFGKKIVIRNLLTHTSGLRDQWGLLDIKGMGPGTQVHSLNTILDLVAHQKALNFDPGAEYLYSNTGYVLSAIIVQRVSGMPFATFTQERLFTPLGMTNTQWRDDFRRVVKNRATAYDPSGRTFAQDMPFTNVHGNGGLLTTVGDLMKWNAFLDSPSVLGAAGPAMVQAMTTPMTLNSGKHITYALGLDVTMREGMREISHSGSTAGYRTWLARYPDEHASVAVLCNAGGGANPTALGTTSALALLDRPRAVVAQAGASVTPLPAAELERYTGLFRGPNPELLAKFVVRNGQLVAALPNNRAVTPSGADRFRAGASDLVFRMDKGKVKDLLQINGADSIIFRPLPLATPSAKELASYSGSYWSEELDTRLNVQARDSVLVLKRRPADEIILRPTFPDGFSAQGLGSLVFSRDKNGKITGFGVWAGRVRDVRFTKEK